MDLFGKLGCGVVVGVGSFGRLEVRAWWWYFDYWGSIKW